MLSKDIFFTFLVAFAVPEADEQEMDDEGAEDADEVQEANVEQREVRRSNRQRHPPDRYRDYVWKLKGEECSDDVTSGVGFDT